MTWNYQAVGKVRSVVDIFRSDLNYFKKTYKNIRIRIYRFNSCPAGSVKLSSFERSFRILQRVYDNRNVTCPTLLRDSIRNSDVKYRPRRTVAILSGWLSVGRWFMFPIITE